VRPGWRGVENGSIHIEEGFVTVVYAQYRAVTVQQSETHLVSYCCIQPFGRGLLSGFSGSPWFAEIGEDALGGAVAWVEGPVEGPRG
jgi:hypothetical protein